MTLSVVIPSRNRQQSLQRLLTRLRDEVAATTCGVEGIDVIVVLDGCSDGSARMLGELNLPVSLSVLSTPGRGAGAARNEGLNHATGELVLFLDDDVDPSDGLVARHRQQHERDKPRVLVGPIPVAEPSADLRRQEDWWRQRYARLSESPRILDFGDVLFANTSAPTRLLRSFGGFDQTFPGSGAEDAEFGIRLLSSGVRIDFDAEAVAWHRPCVSVTDACKRSRQEGRNLVRLAALHPDVLGRPAFLAVRKELRRNPGSSAVDTIRGLALRASAYACLLGASATTWLSGPSLAPLALRVFRRLGIAEEATTEPARLSMRR
jgi:glycosyltransferase involved in cell wall biosynthesis